MVKKNENGARKIKAFTAVKKHWSENLQDPSAELKTSCGRFFVYLHRISNVNHDGFRPSPSPFFPYGVKSVSSGGGLPGMHLYFKAIMEGKVKNPEKRQHYQITLSLPRLKESFIGADVFNYGSQQREFEMFYLPAPARKKEPKPSAKSSNQGWYPVSLYSAFGEGGLIIIPDDLELTRAIEISVKKISEKEWNKGPWRFTDVTRSISFAELEERRNRDYGLPSDASGRIIGASS